MEASTAPTVAAAPAASGTPANSKTTKRITSALDTRGCADIVTFDFEEFIKTKLNLNVDHVPVAQKPRTINDGKIGVCNYFLKGHCWKGNNCIYRHLTREQSERAQYENRAIVCKHWLRGLCKKSDQCEFLHEFNMRKMPECSFFSANGLCTGGNECPYQHINPESRVKECLWYARGFCKHGVKCRSKHNSASAEPIPEFSNPFPPMHAVSLIAKDLGLSLAEFLAPAYPILLLRLIPARHMDPGQQHLSI